ncbi:hypothetical protein ACIRNU_11235 [Streptomyces rochei]|uniref:hypothetical protein n=1 Tax=Streptomyces rochei TaxID=1928 RepID=UPI003821201A
MTHRDITAAVCPEEPRVPGPHHGTNTDTEVAELFRKAQADSRKGAELGKELLRARLSGG